MVVPAKAGTPFVFSEQTFEFSKLGPAFAGATDRTFPYATFAVAAWRSASASCSGG